MEENEIEQALNPILSEYFEHGDTEEVAVSLDEINLGDNSHHILVIAVTLAMERKASHREMISVLISDLYGRLLYEEDIERGFDVLLSSLPDLVLDTPTAATVLGNFIARAVADDCIPPKFVQKHKGVVDCMHARAAIEHADVLLSMKHGLVKLDSVWGVTGGMRPVKYLIKQIQSLLKEFLSSGDIEEATRCLQELEVPHFYHEFVYEAVVMVIEDMGERAMDLICQLLKSLCSSVIITIDQLKNVSDCYYDFQTILIMAFTCMAGIQSSLSGNARDMHRCPARVHNPREVRAEVSNGRIPSQRNRQKRAVKVRIVVTDCDSVATDWLFLCLGVESALSRKAMAEE